MTEKHEKLNICMEKQEDNGGDDRQSACYGELTEACRAMAADRDVTLASVMHVEALRAMSRRLPMTEAEMLEIPHVTQAKFERYGRPLLEITTRYACELAMLSGGERDSHGGIGSQDDSFSAGTGSRRPARKLPRGRKRKPSRPARTFAASKR